jgi:UDP-3-O-acyl-N-acetylglucosamine deacetylase
MVSLGEEGVGVKSVEHVMAALAGLGIDNIEIEITAMKYQQETAVLLYLHNC